MTHDHYYLLPLPLRLYLSISDRSELTDLTAKATHPHAPSCVRQRCCGKTRNAEGEGINKRGRFGYKHALPQLMR